MDENSVLTILLFSNQLKRTPRTGWEQRGVPDAENVAAHSFGVCFVTWVLASEISAPLDLGKALSMAVLHDLPEALTTDIPTPAWRYLPEGSKFQAEEKAVKKIFETSDRSNEIQALWREYQEEHSSEARLVHDADKIDRHIQAMVYEKEYGNQYLAEFWLKDPEFHFDECRSLYLALRALRPESS